MTVIVNNKVLIRDSYVQGTNRWKVWRLHKRDFEGKETVLTARVMQWKITDGQNQIKKLQNTKLRHVGMTVI